MVHRGGGNVWLGRGLRHKPLPKLGQGRDVEVACAWGDGLKEERAEGGRPGCGVDFGEEGTEYFGKDGRVG